MTDGAKQCLSCFAIWVLLMLFLAVAPVRWARPSDAISFGDPPIARGRTWALFFGEAEFLEYEFGIGGVIRVSTWRYFNHKLIEFPEDRISILDVPSARSWLALHGDSAEVPESGWHWSLNLEAAGAPLLLGAVVALLALSLRNKPAGGLGVAAQTLAFAALLGVPLVPAFLVLGQPAPPTALIPAPLALALTLLTLGVGCTVWRRAGASPPEAGDS